MKLKQLETFLWVATLGSFRKAATRLNTTQPAISSRISGLEQTLGKSLFDRGKRTVTLTAFGQMVVPYAEKILYMSDQLKLHGKDANAQVGILRLGVSETIVHTWLSDFLRAAHEKYPMLDVELTVDVTVNLRQALKERTMDLCFLLGPISSHEIANVPLCSYPLIWAASPTLNIGPDAMAIDRLADPTFLTYSRNTRPYSEARARLRLTPGKPARIFPSSSLAAIKRMACDGIGIAMLPIESIRDELAEGALQIIDCDWHPSDLVFTASYPTVPYQPVLERLAALARTKAQMFDQSN